MFVLRYVPKSVQDSVSYCSGTLSYRLKAHEVFPNNTGEIIRLMPDLFMGSEYLNSGLHFMKELCGSMSHLSSF